MNAKSLVSSLISLASGLVLIVGLQLPSAAGTETDNSLCKKMKVYVSEETRYSFNQSGLACYDFTPQFGSTSNFTWKGTRLKGSANTPITVRLMQRSPGEQPFTLREVNLNGSVHIDLSRYSSPTYYLIFKSTVTGY